MKKGILLLIFIIVALIQARADKFIIESFDKAPNDLAARRYERFDVNDDPCAIIKVKTDLEGLIFETNLGITGDVKKKTGVYWVYVSPGEKRIRISKEGFISKDFFIPSDIRIKSHNVYILTVTSNRKFPITVNRSPEDASLIVDGKNHGSKQVVKNLSPGTHVLKLQKHGYNPIVDTVNVSENKMTFDYTMEEVQPVKVEINSEPQNATILLNDNERGKTNKKIFIFPGEYHLKLTQYLYETINDTIEVEKGKPNIFSYKLNKSSGTLAIRSDPKGASVYIDNQLVEIEFYRNQYKAVSELSAGKHSVRVEKRHYHTVSRVIEVKKGKKIERTFTLKPITGKLYLTIVPGYAQVKLLQNDEQKYSFKGDKALNDIQTGTYQLKATAQYHEPHSQMVQIKKDYTTEININLVRKHRSQEVAVLLSTFIPGAGQFYSIKQNARGSFYLLTGMGSAAATLYYMNQTNALQKDYHSIREDYQNAEDLNNINHCREEMMDKYDQLHQAEQFRDYALIAAGTIYAINLLDAIIFGGGKIPIKKPSASWENKDVNVGLMPVRNGMALGVRINIH